MSDRKKGQRDLDWTDIAIDTWFLGAEAWTVVALRTARLARGGLEGHAEARLMVSEKVDSLIELGAHATTGSLGSTPKAVAGSLVSHYLHAVRANRKRLLES